MSYQALGGGIERDDGLMGAASQPGVAQLESSTAAVAVPGMRRVPTGELVARLEPDYPIFDIEFHPLVGDHWIVRMRSLRLLNGFLALVMFAVLIASFVERRHFGIYYVGNILLLIVFAVGFVLTLLRHQPTRLILHLLYGTGIAGLVLAPLVFAFGMAFIPRIPAAARVVCGAGECGNHLTALITAATVVEVLVTLVLTFVLLLAVNLTALCIEYIDMAAQGLDEEASEAARLEMTRARLAEDKPPYGECPCPHRAVVLGGFMVLSPEKCFKYCGNRTAVATAPACRWLQSCGDELCDKFGALICLLLLVGLVVSFIASAISCEENDTFCGLYLVTAIILEAIASGLADH